MARFLLKEQPHRRYNPLNDTWVLVSPSRTNRPWQGRHESMPSETISSYDPLCYLCPGNRRAGENRNAHYRTTFVFDNDFPALSPGPRALTSAVAPLISGRRERGICRVLCFSPRHDVSLAQMTESQILRVVEAWIQQHRDLSRYPWISHVQIFENKGEMMGCSNPHAHGQIWAQESVPSQVSQEVGCQNSYRQRTGTCLLCDYLAVELKLKERVVCQNDHFALVVPFWAVWPFETLLVGKNHHGSLTELGAGERRSLASMMRRLSVRYDNLFEISFPYSMGWHQTPTDGRSYPAVHLHAHYYPPLLRSSTVRKFMVGYEMLGEPQRDITPEQSAERLKKQSEVRYERSQKMVEAARPVSGARDERPGRRGGEKGVERLVRESR